MIDRLPRLLVVQASGAAPFARSYSSGFRDRVAVPAETVATAIRIGDPASHDRAVRAIQRTQGAVVAVSDGAILDAQARVGSAGIGCEPASAAAVAGVRAALQSGLINRAERVVAVLTGHVLKDPLPEAARELYRAPVEIEATLKSLESAVRLAGAL